MELGKHSDVTFIITEDGEDYHIPAHRVILASQSEYFDKLLFGEMAEAHPRVEIHLQDTPLEAFQLLMKYAYCGEMKIEDSDLQVWIVTCTFGHANIRSNLANRATGRDAIMCLWPISIIHRFLFLYLINREKKHFSMLHLYKQDACLCKLLEQLLNNSVYTALTKS